MKILIVGAGIGGLSLAGFLNYSDIEYDIIEKAPDWNHRGYSIALWNNGRNILKKLGLEGEFDTHGQPIHAYHMYTGDGKFLRKVDLNHFYSGYGMALKMVSRSQLHDWLMSKVDEKKIAMSTTVVSILQEGGKNKVVFSDGRMDYYDLVVGADGIHSKVRDLTFHDHVLAKSKMRLWYMWVDNKFKTEASISEYMAAGEFIMLFDTGERTLGVIVAEHHNVVWDDVKGRIERLKKSFKDETQLVPGMFENLKDEDIVPSDLLQVKLKKWHTDNVVLIGDAAHGFGPWAGLGGGMALEDSYILAGELMKISPEYSLDAALKFYNRVRQKRVRRSLSLTHKMGDWAVVRSKVLRKLFDAIVPYFPSRYLVRDFEALLDEEI